MQIECVIVIVIVIVIVRTKKKKLNKKEKSKTVCKSDKSKGGWVVAQDKQSFILYCDIIHTVRKLPDEIAGKLFKHILSYVNDEDPIAEDILIEIAFEPIKQALKRDLKKYEKRRTVLKQNAEKRWSKTEKEEKKPLNNNNLYAIASKSDAKNANGCKSDESDAIAEIVSELDKVAPIEHDYLDIHTYQDYLSVKEEKWFKICYVNEKVQTSILMDLFKIKYMESHGSPYIVGSWDSRTIERLIKDNGFGLIETLINEYFDVPTTHTVKEFSNNLSDRFGKLRKMITPGRMFEK